MNNKYIHIETCFVSFTFHVLRQDRILIFSDYLQRLCTDFISLGCDWLTLQVG